MNAPMTEIESWNLLDMHWQEARERANDAQMDLDYKMYQHLKTGGISPAPTIEEQAAIDQLWEAEGESRGDLDLFIHARLAR